MKTLEKINNVIQIILCIWMIVLLVRLSIHTVNVRNSLKSQLGEEVYINHQPRRVVNYNTLNGTYTLDNGIIVSSDYVDNLLDGYSESLKEGSMDIPRDKK